MSPRPPRFPLVTSADFDRYYRSAESFTNSVGPTELEPESVSTPAVAGAPAASNGTFYKKVAGALVFSTIQSSDLPVGTATDAGVATAIAAAAVADAATDAAAYQPLAAVLSMFHTGTGSPEGVVTAPVGHVYLRQDGGAGTTWLVKESGAGNTGWVGK